MIKQISILKQGRRGWIAYITSEITNSVGAKLLVVKEMKADTLQGLLFQIGSEVNQTSRMGE